MSYRNLQQDLHVLAVFFQARYIMEPSAHAYASAKLLPRAGVCNICLCTKATENKRINRQTKQRRRIIKTSSCLKRGVGGGWCGARSDLSWRRLYDKENSSAASWKLIHVFVRRIRG
jgi:hypothetical protein